LTVTVSGLALTPVKGTRLRTVDRIDLDRAGARGNRRFFVIDDRDRMLNGKQLGELQTVLADYSDTERALKLTFPDGQVVEGEIEPGLGLSTRFFSRTAEARLVPGPWSAALSAHVGQSLRLVESADGGAVDRGARGAVSLISRASMARLAEMAGQQSVDARRFRMLIEIDGLDAHAEDSWVGRQVQIGAATVSFTGHVGRCLITSRDPDSGEIDLPTLDVLGEYRSDLHTTEPLPFGIYGEVIEPGEIRVGDRVTSLPEA
jgi:uncharacterized protein